MMTLQKDKTTELLKEMDPQANIESSHAHYSDEKFWEKLMKYGKKAGAKSVYYSLLLYYTAQNPAVPKSAKLTIIGALGYLIFPVDLIPDFIPVVGLADDASLIVYALYQVISHVDEETKQRAHEKMKSWFGENYDDGEMDQQFLPKS